MKSCPAEGPPGIEVSGQSDIGCHRENNEDSFAYWEPEDDQQFQRKGRLAVVADGMGGYEGGQEASRLAVETIIAFYRDSDGHDPQEALAEAIQTAHEQIRQYASPIRNCAGWEPPAPGGDFGLRRGAQQMRSTTCMLATPVFT